MMNLFTSLYSIFVARLGLFFLFICMFVFIIIKGKFMRPRTSPGGAYRSASAMAMVIALFCLSGTPIRSRIWDLFPNEIKVLKWSQKNPNFVSKSKFSDHTFSSDTAEKEDALSGQSLLCPI